MQITFSLTKDYTGLYPGLRFETFQLFVKGNIGEIKPGFPFYLQKEDKHVVVVQEVTFTGENLRKPDKQEGILEVKYQTRDPHDYFPPRLLKKRAVFVESGRPVVEESELALLK